MVQPLRKWTRRAVLGATASCALGTSIRSPAARAAEEELPAGCAGQRPDIVIFMPDELRADALACYGNPIVRTPNFDRLARSGTRFENCHVQFPVCAASRCSMLTGWPTSVRGHRSLYFFLQPDEPNMFRYLRQAGYEVYLYGKNDALAPASFADSVSQWTNPRGPTAEFAAIQRPQHPTTMLLPAAGERRGSGDYAAVQLAIKQLSQRETEHPRCIFLALFQPHPPYTVPADFYSLYRAADVPAPVPPGLPRRPRFHAALRAYAGLGDVTESQFRRLRAVYYGQVSYADWLLGELLEGLERTPRCRDTLLVVCSDHGDYTGDYGLVEKWPSGLEDCLTRVPLIARTPGGAAGHVSQEMVELFDLMPTCLELAGTRATHTHFARSLLPQLHGAPGDPERSAFTEGGYNTYEPQAFEPIIEGLYGPKTHLQNERPDTITRCAAVRTPRFKYIERPNDQSELYDCRDDPHQEHNLCDDSSMRAVQAQLQTRLANWYINTTGVPPPQRDPRGAAVLDKPADLSHVATPESLLDH